ncbi:Glycyl-glycine endopeptidase ALE-1 precursor [compost metagenome]
MYKITSRYLEKESFREKGHSGIDFAMPNGTELRSIQNGEIIKIVDYHNLNIGKGILVQWEDGKVAIYGHLSRFNPDLQVGDKVNTGDLLGYSGNSGHVVGQNGGYHLHFGVKENGSVIDPSEYIQDIQNMNDPQYLANLQSKSEAITQSSYSMFDMFKESSNIYNDLFQNLKLNLIYLIDNSMLIHYFQHLLQLIS